MSSAPMAPSGTAELPLRLDFSRLSGWLLRFRKTSLYYWAQFKESRLGVMGLGIILAFGFMAVFAPVISPYGRNFVAPTEDVFTFLNYTKTVDAAQGPWYDPLVGSTTPNLIDAEGGQWLIISRPDGRLEMDFMRVPVQNESVFERGGIEIRTQLADHGFALPISPVAYVAPGEGIGRVLGARDRNGLLAFAANSTFVLFNPFTNTTLFSADLGFVPRWILIDPLSAGLTYDIPRRQLVSLGLIQIPKGPYRLLGAADENRVVVYRVEYLNNENGLLSPVGPPILDVAAPSAGQPFLYQNQDRPQYNAVLIPLSNGTLATYNGTDGTLRGYATFTLEGEPATLSAPISAVRADYPQRALLSLASQNWTGLVFYDTERVRAERTFAIPDRDLILRTSADAPVGETVFIGADHRNADPEFPTGRILKIIQNLTTGNLSLDLSFQGDFEDRIAGPLFFSPESSTVYFLGGSGTIYTAATTVGGQLVKLGVRPAFIVGPGAQTLLYTGTFAGGPYSIATANNEAFGLYFDNATGEIRLFQLVGINHAPVGPGKYPSGNRYWLGTDFVGHDILTRMFWGSRVAFLVGVLAAFFAVVIGSLIGVISGYMGGLTDTLLMRITDIFLTLPFLAIVIVLTRIAERSSIWIIIIALAVLGWSAIARVIRAQTLSLRERPFVDAARISGASSTRVMFRHIMPNVLPFAFFFMMISVSGAIVTEAILSYLGLGDSKVISWGQMLSDIQVTGNLGAWWWLIPPGLAITLLALGFYLVGRAFDQIVNPKLRRRG